MKSIEKYTIKDVELVQEVINEKLIERTEKSEDWIEDKNLPRGWKTRITGTTRKQFFFGTRWTTIFKQASCTSTHD